MVENYAGFARTVIEQFLLTHDVEVVPTIHAADGALAANRHDAILVD